MFSRLRGWSVSEELSEDAATFRRLDTNASSYAWIASVSDRCTRDEGQAAVHMICDI